MKRTEKYPETSTFHYHNANPKGRITGDCTFRAISTATGNTWTYVVMDMAEYSCLTGYAINDKKGIERYLKTEGWTKHPQPRKANGTKYTGKEFCNLLDGEIGGMGKSVIADIGGHHIVCIKEHDDGRTIRFKVHDIWDSTDKCIGNYWTK